MGTPVLVLGPSGSGKSASMRNLDPNTYGIINVARKPLPFRTTKQAKNTDDYNVIAQVLSRAVADIIVIDDAQYLMANAFMRRAKEKGFEKFTEIGLDFFNLINYIIDSLPPQKIVYVMGHTELDMSGGLKFKTIGKMLDEKITIEGMFTIVMRAMFHDGHYYFSTRTDGADPVKTPIGMFDEPYLDNDLAIVDAAIRDYYGFGAPALIKPADALTIGQAPEQAAHTIGAEQSA